MAVAVADEGPRFERDAWRQARQFATILDVNRRLALGLRLDDVLSRITDEAGRLVGADIARLLLVLRARQEDGQLHVEVADHGPGIPPEEQPRIWEKFYRGAAARLSPYRSSGLGLAMVEHLIELHGGRVGLTSAPAQGATFWLTIPLAK